MLKYLIAILGLAALCGVWVLLQSWLERLDPEPDDDNLPRSRCGGCSGCNSNEE